MKNGSIIFAFFLSLLLPLQVHAGSYLFCVNKHNSSEWQWAPAQHGGHDYYKEHIPADAHGTWISGSYSWNLYLHGGLRVSPDFNSFSAARNFCSALQKICTDAFGPNFNQVGVSTYDVARAVWGYVYTYAPVDPKGRPEDKWNCVCPNWNYPEGGHCH